MEASGCDSSSILNASDQLMDVSIKNFWIIVHYPQSDPGSEFEIVSKKDLVFDFDVIEKGAMVTIKVGTARLQGDVVAVSDDHDYLSDNFQSIVDEYREEKRHERTIHKKLRNIGENRLNNFKQNIKVYDKATQTDLIKDSDANNRQYFELKQQYEELQNKYNTLKSIVAEVKSDLRDSASKLSACEDDSSAQKSSKIPLLLQSDENFCKENSSKMVQIGSGGTKISRQVFNSIKWSSYTAATRKLLITLFPRSVLATHSLTGKPSPAFITSNKQIKMRLNATIISDIIEIITKKCMVSESLVRNAITTKCADENKMYKKRLEKKQSGNNKIDDENDDGADSAKKIKLM